MNKAQWMLWLSAIGCCMAPFSFGISLAFTSPVVPDLQMRGILSPQSGSWFSSLMPLGALVGALLGGQMLDLCGRKSSLLLLSFPFSAGWLLILIPATTDTNHPALTLPLLYGGRVLTGLASGAAGVISPTYLAEIAPSKLRGTIGTLNQLFITFGVFYVYLLGLFFDWRWITAAAAIPATGLALFMVFLPESPRWLLSKDQYQEAFCALERVRDTDFTTINNELEDIKLALSRERPFKPRDLMLPSVYRPLFVSLGLMVFQQLCGINAIVFNAESIFEQSGFHDKAAAAAILGAVQIVATGISVLVVDKAGRRILLMISGSGMLVCLILVGVADYLKNLSVLSLSAVLVYIVFFSIGFGPICWLLMSEVFPNYVKLAASSIATLVNLACAFIVTKTFLDLQVALEPYGCYWFYAGCTLVSLFFIFFLVPETKGVPLERVAELFHVEDKRTNPTEKTRLLSADA